MRNNEEPVFLVLAAGRSRRFGSNKLLAKTHSDQTVLQQTVQRIRQVSNNIVVVLNTAVPETTAALQTENCGQISLTSSGLGDSIAYAVTQCADSAGWLICLGDMPFISADVYQRMLARILSGKTQHDDMRGKNECIIRPRYAGQAGHPVYFPKHYYTELVALGGDKGASDVLVRHNTEIDFIDVSDRSILFDVDRPEDLRPENSAEHE